MLGKRRGSLPAESLARRIICALAVIGLTASTVASLSACGNKGPLYLPKASKTPPPQTQQSDDEQSKKHSKKQQ